MENNTISYVEFKTDNLEKTKEFYTKIFGWEFKDYGPTYSSFSNSGLHGGFEVTKEKISKGALIVLYHNDLKSVKTEIIQNGGEISIDIFEFPGGKRFHFLDPAGNELAVWSDK